MKEWTADGLIAFSRRIEEAYLAKKFSSPIHFCSDSQAQPLIDIFKDVKPTDWIFCTWRSMFHCLLKGMPEDELFQQYLEGRSMYVCSSQYKIVCSSIVGGILPMACGVAMGIQRSFDNVPRSEKASRDRVFVFIGDMAFSTGLCHEFKEYVSGHRLPVKIIIEDNGLSTNADTEKTWRKYGRHYLSMNCYQYTRDKPHVGLSTKISF